MQRIYYFLTICAYGFSFELIDQFKICKRSDPNLNDCLKDAIQIALPLMEYGIPEFGVPSIQPIEIPIWTTKKDPSTMTFEQTYSDIKIYNLAGSKVNSVESTITDTDFFLNLKLYNSLIKFTAKYDFKEAIVADKDLSGNGYALFVDIGNNFDMNITGSVTQNADKSILEVKSVDLLIESDHIDVNLKHSHFELNKANSEHLNKNSKLLFKLLNRGYHDMIVDDVKLICNSIFSQVDFNQLFPK
ncbi:hypothetical protein FQR65_LT02931 [Abscondita terminalis]|nr:hypothetical protein FQR65_LT02931 [Abscondita terminalis]